MIFSPGNPAMSFAPVSTLMPGMIPASVRTLTKGVPSVLLLTDRLVVEDRATNALTETRRSHNQLP